jgi:hypothetical protein
MDNLNPPLEAALATVEIRKMPIATALTAFQTAVRPDGCVKQ